MNTPISASKLSVTTSKLVWGERDFLGQEVFKGTGGHLAELQQQVTVRAHRQLQHTHTLLTHGMCEIICLNLAHGKGRLKA